MVMQGARQPTVTVAAATSMMTISHIVIISCHSELT